MENLEILKEITHKLPSLADFVILRKNKVIDYEIEGGHCVGVSLLNNSKVAIQDSFMKAGTLFPLHAHDVIEIIVVYDGEAECVSDSVTHLTKGDVIKFEVNSLHTCKAITDSHIIGITIPSSPNYPRDE
jgi:quercetin dioxygenase-like cupin family protein